MDHSAFGGSYYSSLATAIPPSLRYSYPPTPSSTPAATNGGGGGRGGGGSLLFYPSGGQSSLPEMTNNTLLSSSDSKASCSSSHSMEDSEQDKRPVDKKMRRQIANSNERRRMQSINSGFHTLRLLMPHLQGEKLSKASVLQHAAEHIFRLNQERERLIQQNSTMRMMLTKYWATSDTKGGGVIIPGGGGDTCHTDGKVSKATSPIMLDDEKAAAKELEQIFSTGHEMEVIKEELQRERALRIRAEAKNRVLQEASGGEDSEEGSDSECFSSRKRSRTTPEPRNNLDIIVRAIRQIEGDAFSRSATPTCATQDRSGLFVPITTTTDGTSRMSPITPVFAS